MNRWAALFDWDGVVVDSMKPHEDSWIQLAHERGLPLREGDFERGFGMKNREIILGLYAWTDNADDADALGDRKEFLFREILKRDGLVILPGVRALLEDLRLHDIPCVIGSSTPRANLDCALVIGGLSGLFCASICAEDVQQGKPAPDVFLKAAAAAGVTPDCCVVLEDAPAGIAAGRAAGMKVLAVTTTRPPDKLAQAHRIVASLTEIRASDLRQLVEA